MEFLYIKIPVGPALAGREHAIHEALENALAARSAGSLVGWGASMDGDPRAGGRHVAFHRIDVEVTGLALARALLQDALVALAVPVGTELHFAIDHVATQQVYGPAGWGPPQPSEPLAAHRGHPPR